MLDVPSNSELSSPVLVQNKEDTVRFCIDYRNLNESTDMDSNPLPRISVVIDSIGPIAKCFPSLDFAIMYHQVRIATKHNHKTAFPLQFGLSPVHGDSIRVNKRSRHVSGFNGPCIVIHELNG